MYTIVVVRQCDQVPACLRTNLVL